nr:hypothetical protein [Tanacetum cinerariifolium]GFB40488.1 hypothetical protein [Tanacetum cinerariifolium]
MVAPGPSNLVPMCAIGELVDFSTQNSRTCLAKLNAMIAKMEATDDPTDVYEDVYDSLMCLRDDKRAENDKLMLLNEVIIAAEEDIGRKEAHVEIIKVAISSG